MGIPGAGVGWSSCCGSCGGDVGMLGMIQQDV